MTLIGGTLMGGRGSAKSVTLNDTSGVDSFDIKDADGFIVARITSAGDLNLKGIVGRTETD